MCVCVCLCVCVGVCVCVCVCIGVCLYMIDTLVIRYLIFIQGRCCWPLPRLIPRIFCYLLTQTYSLSSILLQNHRYVRMYVCITMYMCNIYVFMHACTCSVC